MGDSVSRDRPGVGTAFRSLGSEAYRTGTGRENQSIGLARVGDASPQAERLMAGLDHRQHRQA
jgi:hypothetical protein